MSKPNYKNGERVQFEIIPINPGLVFSRLKYCSISHLNRNLTYDLYWPMKSSLNTGNTFCKDKIVDFKILSPLVTKYNIKGEFSSFSWNLNATNSHFLNCGLELSTESQQNRIETLQCQN